MKWLKLKNRSQDFICLMGAVELVILALHVILKLEQVSQGWTTASLRIANIMLIIAFSVWFIANWQTARAGMIHGTAFDPIAGGMVLTAYALTLIPGGFMAYFPLVIVWAVPIIHILLGITWSAIRLILEFSGQS